MTETDDSGPIKSSATQFALVEAIRERGDAGVSELARELEVSKSTVHRHLTTLADHGYVIKEDGRYRLSLTFLDVASQVRNRREPYRRIKQTVFDLAYETGELVSFVVEEDDWGVFLYRVQGAEGVESDAYVGKHAHLHHTSAGKALLSSLPDERIREIVERRGLPPKTDATITDEAELFDEIETIRERGVALAAGEHTKGLSSVGAPVTLPNGEVLGGLSVAGPSFRLEGERFEETLPNELLGVVNEFELNVAYS